MASTDALPVPRKSANYRLYVAIQDTSGKMVTGGLTGKTCQISKDGAAFGAPAGGSTFTEIGTSGCGYVELTGAADTASVDHLKVVVTASNTNAVDSVYDLYLEEAGDIRVNLTQINSDAALIAKFAAAVGAGEVGTVLAGASGTAFTSADVNDAQADLYNGRFLIFLTGALAGKATKITDYVQSAGNGSFTVETLPLTPAGGVSFLIL
jgi:hypothetical protein